MDKRLQAITTQLLEGKFICQFSDPDNFVLLQDDVDTRLKVENCLETLGRKLVINDSQSTYYVVHDKNTIDQKTEAEKQFNHIRQKIRPTLGFLDIISSALTSSSENKVFLQGGETIKISEVIAGLEHNQAHIDTLTRLDWIKRKDSPITDKVKTLFKEAEKEGLLALQDKVTERYLVTGKLDVMQEIMLFIAENEQLGSTELEPNNDQMKMKL